VIWNRKFNTLDQAAAVLVPSLQGYKGSRPRASLGSRRPADGAQKTRLLLTSAVDPQGLAGTHKEYNVKAGHGSHPRRQGPRFAI